jgi:Flp pilus assembly protein TadG
MDIKAILQRLSPVPTAFAVDRRGNIAMTFALATLPVMALVGAAVDYSHAAAVRTSMQSALDATALAISKLTPLPADPTDAASNYFKGLFTLPEQSTVHVTAVYNNTGKTSITVGATGSVTGSFLPVVGALTAVAGVPGVPKDMSISASSTVNWGMTKLQVALALDNTGSMADNGKMAALKKATHDLLTQLQNAATDPADVQVAIIPFATDVNIGPTPTNQAAPWIDWSNWHGSSGFCFLGWCWNGSSWVQQGSAGSHANWNGCITDRNQDYDVSNATPDPANKNTMFLADQSTSCPAAMMPLTNNYAALNGLVDQMQPAGNTNQTIGLVWAWHALTKDAPLNAPAPTQDTQQVIILLTDGLNTANRFSTNATDVDARTRLVCTNIKNADNGTPNKIQIFTVLVMAGNSAILQACATPNTASKNY